MKILVVGSGGREHALVWSLARSPRRPELFIAPGNPGTASLGTNVPISATDLDALCGFAASEGIDLVVVGPEQPLVLGLVDRLDALDIPAVGPTARAARLEGSKAFAKAFMAKYGIPTAGHYTFAASQYEAADAYLAQQGAPIVVKASGLAAGKGAVVCETIDEARTALREMMKEGRYGASGSEVVIEEFMHGEEASFFAVTDGNHYILLATAQDHKRIGEGDTGPNTGGMGAYAPAPLVTPGILRRVCREVIEPTLAGMRREGCPYRGILYAGMMITAAGPKVVEFNCRLGDPETQVVLPLLQNDLVDVFTRLVAGRLDLVTPVQRPGSSACVVMASEGYPGAYEKGRVIEGIEEAGEAAGVEVFQAGTRRDDAGNLVTAGGRVLAVSARGGDLTEALEKVYRGVEAIRFEGAYYRKDIGQKGLARLAE